MYTHPRYSVQISIHALREEGDGLHDVREDDTWYFYPRPPRGGRRHRQVSQGNCKNFYPRPPRGGRPCRDQYDELQRLFLSTPSARRATGLIKSLSDGSEISIHALREEGDLERQVIAGRRHQFLSTPSARRATGPRCSRLCCREISIHALREEGDAPFFQLVGIEFEFLSTPSARRATRLQRRDAAGRRISIHALREEGDKISHNPTFSSVISIHALREEGDAPIRQSASLATNFYPRPPRGGRPSRPPSSLRFSAFLSTPSARRATARRSAGQRPDRISIHALREEGDGWAERTHHAGLISIHALREEGDAANQHTPR